MNQWKKYVGVEQNHGEKTLKTFFSSFVFLTATKMCVLLRSHRSNCIGLIKEQRQDIYGDKI